MKIKKTINSCLKYLFIALLFAWILVSLVRTFYNFSKVYAEELSWVKLSDFEQRERIFGKKFTLLQEVRKISNDESRILFVFNDNSLMNGFNYLSNYNLYPRKITVALVNKDYVYKDYDLIVFVFPKYKKIVPSSDVEKFQATNFAGDNFNSLIFKK